MTTIALILSVLAACEFSRRRERARIARGLQQIADEIHPSHTGSEALSACALLLSVNGTLDKR